MLKGQASTLMLVDDYKLYWAWYKKLRKNYGIFTSLSSAWYNYKYYNIDGKYK